MDGKVEVKKNPGERSRHSPDHVNDEFGFKTFRLRESRSRLIDDGYALAVGRSRKAAERMGALCTRCGALINSNWLPITRYGHRFTSGRELARKTVH